MKHFLIIGGTGMLGRATRHFIAEGNKVTLLARDPSKLEMPGGGKSNPNVSLIAGDYRDAGKAMEKVKQAVNETGPVNVAILWIHDTGREFSARLKENLLSMHPTPKVFELFGSAREHPGNTKPSAWKEKYPAHYREIILGFKIENRHKRWLTHDEISNGTIHAIREDLPRYIIGVVEPWGRRLGG